MIVQHFKQLTELNTLTLFADFGDSLGGELVLPSEGNITTLLVHNNRLSCQIGDTSASAVNSSRNLVLPGNMFSSPIPVYVWAHPEKCHSYTLVAGGKTGPSTF